MDVPLSEVVYFDCITSHPTTGAVSDADSTPTFAVFEEATDTDIGVGGNLTKRTSLTGNYRGSFTASAANGFEAGKWYNVIASATVNSIDGKAVVMRFRAVQAENVAGVPTADLTHWKGTAPASLADTDKVPTSVQHMASNVFTAAAVNADAVTEIATAVLETALNESYAADGVEPTLTEAVMLIQQTLTDFVISNETLTVRQLDGSSTAATLTLNDATTPTGVTRTG